MARFRSFEVDSPASAEEALEYFNAFHDGFMQSIVLDSVDRIEADLSQSCSGLFEVTILFAHYNYPVGALQAADRLVEGRFHGVREPYFDLADDFLGNTIIQLAAGSVTRSDPGGNSEEAIELLLGRNFYFSDERRYDYREARLFTFRTASFREASRA